MALAYFLLLLKAVAERVDRAAAVADEDDDDAEMVAVDPADDACVARIRINALACDALERIARPVSSRAVYCYNVVSWF